MKKIFNFIYVYVLNLYLSFVGSVLCPHPLRPIALRLVGISVGVQCMIASDTIFHKTKISVGNFCSIGRGVFLDGSGSLEIADRVHVGINSIILTGTHRIMPSIYRRDRLDDLLLKTVISRGCWIGTSSIILPGVKVGEGCVVAAGSVVTANCEPNFLYAGIPAKKIKPLPVDTERPFFGGKEVMDPW